MATGPQTPLSPPAARFDGDSFRAADHGLSRPIIATPPYVPPAGRRWAGSAWAFVRQGSGASLGRGGMLGGNQVGGRVSYGLNDPATGGLAAVIRAYAAFDDAETAEAAVGIEWQPIRRLPMRLLAERREALGDNGRSAFSLLAYGGVSDRPLAGPVLLDGYAQAGVVGLRSRDLFADGSLRIGVAARDRLKIGVGAWGAAQPGVSRLDVGPQASIRVPIESAGVILAADWRFRIAGNAEPGSGPTLTLSTDF